jgi:ABC-type dipeptide/oligopeptide/nickel transport system ATPase component
MLSTSEIYINKGSSHFWGMKTAGRKFTLSIHPKKNKEKIGITWDNQRLKLKVLKANLIVQSRGEMENINLLTGDSYSFNHSAINGQGLIQAEIELITNGGEVFEQAFEVHQGSDTSTLVIGLKIGATEGIDTSLGEKKIATPLDEFYAGLRIKNGENKNILSHRDIRSPVDLYTAEATLTITPKFDQAYIGKIDVHTTSVKHRHVEFGLLSSATDEEDEHLGEKDITATLQEGIFEAGFVIGQDDSEILSPKDLRSLQAGLDIDKEVSSILAKVDLNDEDQAFRKQYPKEISGGQGQRVMISLAMAAKPEVLIADEPTTGLDVTKQTEVVQLFRQYKDQGRTIVLISHDLSFVSHLADYYTIMYAGTDVEHIPNNMMENTDLLHPYTRRLLEIASSGDADGFSYIEKDAPDPYRSNLSGCPFEPRCKQKENIPTSSDNEHICKQLFPPIINADSGNIIKTGELDGEGHFIRCWLYLKT